MAFMHVVLFSGCESPECKERSRRVLHCAVHFFTDEAFIDYFFMQYIRCNQNSVAVRVMLAGQQCPTDTSRYQGSGIDNTSVVRGHLTSVRQQGYIDDIWDEFREWCNVCETCSQSTRATLSSPQIMARTSRPYVTLTLISIAACGIIYVVHQQQQDERQV